MTPPGIQRAGLGRLPSTPEEARPRRSHSNAPRGAHGESTAGSLEERGLVQWTEIAGAHAYPCGFETLRTSV
jgi:hypothetical protein